MYKIIHIDYGSKRSHCFELSSETSWLEWIDAMEDCFPHCSGKIVFEGKFTDGDEEWVVV